MEILYLMILCSVSLAAVFLGLFIYAIKKGQFDDDESPAVRILFDSDEGQNLPEVRKTEEGNLEEKNKPVTRK